MNNIYESKIIKKEEIADKIWMLKIKVNDETFSFNAGQYVWLITSKGRRPFSISSSSTNKGEIEIVFKENDLSIYKKDLLSKEVGDEIKIRGPFGFMRIPQDNQKTVYIAGGVGCAPVLSILRSLRDNNLKKQITFVFVNHNKQSDIYPEEIEKMPNINLIKVFGKIDRTNIPMIKDAKYVVLGSTSFVDAVYDVLKEYGITEKEILFEENYPSKNILNVNLATYSIFKSAVDLSINHIIITDLSGKIVYANKVAEETTGYSFSEMQGQTPRLWGGNAEKEVYEHFWDTIKNKNEPYKGEFVNQRKDGEFYEVLVMVSPVKDDGGVIVGYLGVEQDVTLYKKSLRDIKKLNDLMIGRELKMVELKNKIKNANK